MRQALRSLFEPGLLAKDAQIGEIPLYGVPEPRVVPAMPQPVISDEESPFGPDEDFSGMEVQAKGYGNVSGTKGTGSPFNARDRYEGAVKKLSEIHPGLYWSCDMKAMVGHGQDLALIDRDALGCLDIVGVSRGQLIGCNVTTKNSINAHLSKWTNPTNYYKGKVFGAETKRVLDLIRGLILNGGRLYLVGAHKPGRLWEYEVREVTETILAKVIARKRS